MPELDPALLALLREDGGDGPWDWLDLAALDWPAQLAIAKRQGVAPLLYQRLLAAQQLDRLPPSAAAGLHLAFHRQWGINTVCLQTLEHVTALLAAAGIHPIALKGAGLVLTVYEELALRPMGDIDLLVAPEQFRPALQCLLSAGGVATHEEPFAGAYETVTHHVALEFPQVSRVVVELHHQWLSLPARQASLVSAAELHSRARSMPVGAQRVGVLADEDQVLHLCAHLSIHSAVMQRLIWTYDVDQVIRRAGPGLDWEAIVQRALRFQMALPLREVLATAQAAWGTPLPAGLLARLEALPVSAAERQRYGEEAWGVHSRLGDGVQKLAGLPDLPSRLRFAWRLAFPARDYVRLHYPDDSPARLAARYPERWLAVLREFAAVRRRSAGKD
jgi:hypothetical protein